MVNGIDSEGFYNAFEDVTKFTFTKEGHERSKTASSIFAEGDSRSTMLQQRYYTILQQIFRDSKFIDTARGKRGADFPVISFGGDSGSPNESETSNSSSLLVIHAAHKETDETPDTKVAPVPQWRFEVTPVESLPGSTGIKVVFGMLSRGMDGKLVIEDIHQAVVVKIDSVAASDDFITENTFILAKGSMIDEVFHIYEMTLPPVPIRSLCEGAVNTSGGPGDLTEEVLTHTLGDPPQDATIAIVSNINLDDPMTLEKLSALLTGFEEADSVPSAFVFMGDFISKKFNPFSGDSLRAFQKGFDALSQILSKHPKTLENAKVVIVPGANNDPGQGALPQPPFADTLVRGISSRFPNVVLGTNPCRIRFYNKNLVFFNGNVSASLRKTRIIGNGSTDDGEDFAKFARCIFSQLHLIPGPVRDKAIIWDHDQGLRLYPPPHALIYGDPDLKAGQINTVGGETLLIAPPCFSDARRTFDFHLYTPHSNESMLSEVSEST